MNSLPVLPFVNVCSLDGQYLSIESLRNGSRLVFERGDLPALQALIATFDPASLSREIVCLDLSSKTFSKHKNAARLQRLARRKALNTQPLRKGFRES